MKRKIDGGFPRAARWMQLLGCVFGLALMLAEPLSAQSKPKTKDLLGDWYLDFKFAETTKLGTKEHALFDYSKRVVADGGNTKYYYQNYPITLSLMEGGKAQLHYKEMGEGRSVYSGRTVNHSINITRTTVPLKWWLNGNRISFSLLPSNKKATQDGIYELIRTNDSEVFAGDGDFGDMEDEWHVDMFEDNILKNLVENLSRMTLENFTPTSFVLNGRSTFKPLIGVHMDPIGEVRGWYANMVYASKEETKESPILYDQEQSNNNKMLQLASDILAKSYMKAMSPRSGQKPRSNVWTSTVEESSEDGRSIRSNVELLWEARDLLSGVPYGTCEVAGELRIYPPQRSVDKWKAVFEMHSKNDHAARVTTETNWKNADRVVFDFEEPFYP